MTGSIGEGMVDMTSNPTGDYRVVQIKRASANLIDIIEQMEAHQGSQGQQLKEAAMKLIAAACEKAVEAAVLRNPVQKIPPAYDQPGGTGSQEVGGGPEPEGAPV